MASDDFNWITACMAPVHMTEQEKSLRDLFISEYLTDYDQVAAAMRCGFLGSFAADYAKKFMAEPYVQKKLTDLQLIEPVAKTDVENEDKLNKRKIVMALMREAHNQFNSGAARVAALAKLMSHYGMDAPTKTQNEHIHRGGVMQVPAIADINAWEVAAVDSQTKLVQDTRAEA